MIPIKTYYYIIFLILRCLYYFGEGATEAYTWKYSNSWDHSNIYHAWRELVENMGDRLLVWFMTILLIGFWKATILMLITELIGLSIYELKYRHIKLGSIFADKSGHYILKTKWFKIKFKYPNYVTIFTLLVVFFGMFVIFISRV